MPAISAPQKSRLHGVATRVRWLSGTVAAPASAGNYGGDSGRMMHVASQDLTAVRAVLGNFFRGFDGAISNKYILESGLQSTTFLTRAEVGLAIEYPLNTIVGTVTFDGASTKVLDVGDLVVSDLCILAATIPRNAQFYTRPYYKCGRATSSGIVPFSSVNTAATNEGRGLANPVVDQRTGTMTVSQFSQTYGPLAIVADTHPSGKAVLVVGDSISEGTGDTTSGYSWIERTLMGVTAFNSAGAAGYATHDGSGYAVINAGQGNMRAVEDAVKTYSRARCEIAARCTDVIIQLGRNDLTDLRTGAQIAADITTIIANLHVGAPNVRCWVATIPPKTASTDAWMTAANQTVDSTDTERAAANVLIRAGLTGAQGVLDIAAAVESGSTGKWKVTTQTGNATGVPTVTGIPDTSGFYVGQSCKANGTSRTVVSKTSSTIVFSGNVTAGTGIALLGAFSDDGIHPNAGGHALIAATLGTAALG